MIQKTLRRKLKIEQQPPPPLHNYAVPALLVAPERPLFLITSNIRLTQLRMSFSNSFSEECTRFYPISSIVYRKRSFDSIYYRVIRQTLIVYY
jgi:hypothetical protein